MNVLQRYARELIAANQDANEQRESGLVWRGQRIDRVESLREGEDDAPGHEPSWLERVANDD